MRVVAVTLAAALVAGPATAADRPDPSAVAKRIDHHIGAKLDVAKVKPAPIADDAMFLRRTYLVLVGRIPMPSEVHAFLEDTDPAKRAKLIDKLLDSPGYANHFTTVWRGWMLPEALTSFEVAALSPSFEIWLRKQLAANVAYNKLVTDLLTVPVAQSRNPPAPQPVDPEEQTPFGTRGAAMVFYYAKEAKAENLAAATARLFLGVQLDCAQCHDHPFAKWSRDQFWGLAGFFAGIETTQPNNFFAPLREVFDRRELVIPNTDRVVQATFLDDKEPEWRAKTSSRVTLAEWITDKNNAFFARATANRMWGYVFGTGVYEPVDDFTDEHRPSHPEMLDELSAAFADSGFDLKFLLRAILLSDTYQRDSARTETGQDDPRLFARFPVQGMTPEQLYDSLTLIASSGQEPGGVYLQNPGSGKRQFVEKFGLIGGKTESPSSILQALTLMNGDLVATASQPGQSRVVGVVTSLPGLTDAERVDVLYLTALGRKPKPAELERAIKHVGAGPADKAKQRYGDLLWALLNSAEFRTNH
jgi:hypothetical protein